MLERIVLPVSGGKAMVVEDEIRAKGLGVVLEGSIRDEGDTDVAEV